MEREDLKRLFLLSLVKETTGFPNFAVPPSLLNKRSCKSFNTFVDFFPIWDFSRIFLKDEQRSCDVQGDGGRVPRFAC
jgi:hypothetical protein